MFHPGWLEIVTVLRVDINYMSYMRHRLKQVITAQQEDNFETLTSAFKKKV